jgi:hypothetical protein
MLRRHARAGGVVLLAALVLAPAPSRIGAVADRLPTRLSDAEFWSLSERLSEPDGTFRSDNLVSNEVRYPDVIPALVGRVKTGGVYLGVGPEQNFNYIAAVRPRMVFITDVRRGNLHVHLMYKALFELSDDRNAFVARLFSKPNQPGMGAETPVGDLMTAYWALESSPKSDFDRNLQQIRDQLTKGPHRFPLSEDDLDAIAGVYYQFYWFGPTITYNSSNSSGFGRGSGSMVTYDDLMRASDEAGVARSYLATEEGYRFVRELHRRNLIVPVVGNFGGPRALRSVGQYLREHGASVSVFYLSNVEQYLRQDFLWDAFCANVASMPLTADSTFIRSATGGSRGFGGGFSNFLGVMQAETAGCAASGPVATPTGR